MIGIVFLGLIVVFWVGALYFGFNRKGEYPYGLVRRQDSRIGVWAFIVGIIGSLLIMALKK